MSDPLAGRREAIYARVSDGRVVLPREVRLALLRGERPSVTTPGKRECPIKPGMTYKLGSKFSLRFTDIRRNRKGDHACIYTICDFRPLTLTTRPPASDARRRERQHWSPEEEHGYSRSPDALDAGEVLDRIDQREIDKQAEVRAEQQAVLTRADRADRYELGQRLDRVRERAEHERIDVSGDVRVIQKRIEALERKILDKAA